MNARQGEEMIFDYLKQLKRGPQVVLPKDTFIIIGFAGLNKESMIIDAGTGSGWFAVQASFFVKKVISYEKNPTFAELAKKNIEKLKIENVEIKIKDVVEEGFDEKNVDMVFLDMANSHLAVEKAIRAIKENGTVVGYLPHFEQLKVFAQECKKCGLERIYAAEIIQRQILIREAGIRPENVGLVHTAYLLFAKKGKEVLTKIEQKRRKKLQKIK